MRNNRPVQAPRRVLLLFLAVTLLPGAALGWVSWQLIEQDRELEDKRAQDDLEHAADVVSAALDRRLRDAAEQLSEGTEPGAELPEGALTVVFDARRIEAKPANRLLYYPSVPLPAAGSPVFDAGEALEYRKDYAGAIAVFRELSQSQDPSIRAGALARLARNLRLSGQTQAALDVYTQLERLGSVLVGTVPAGLFAREARCDTLWQAQRHSELQREVALLVEDLKTGRWPVDRLDFNRLHEEEIPRWRGGAVGAEALNEDALALAESVEWVWQEWRKMRPDQAVSIGRQSLWRRDRPVLVLWRGSASSLTAFIAGRDYIQSQWSSAWTDHGVDVALSDAEGHPVLGAAPAKTLPVAVRSAAESQLPWALRATPANPDSVSVGFTARRRLLLTGLVIMVVLTATGGYFTVRAASREFAVARLQSDFVSAVSHEFRTPLTSLRHLTELLEAGTIADEDRPRRQQCYRVLARETERLHRMVEGLLDFGRMEARGDDYALETVDPAEFVQQIVADFRSAVATPLTHRIEVAADGVAPGASVIKANREALGRAVRNLLENAVKYSPESKPVQVTLGRRRDRIAIGVHDEGFGIPSAEQKAIFEKFVRGAASKAMHVQGTGIGLAMARHIVRAHGGEIRVESEPGRGTTFTIELPAFPAPAVMSHEVVRT
jgi:signal transduction histidine kinase